MKKTSTATVWLIILNALVFLAGICAALNVMRSSADLLFGALFLAVLPAPLVIVWSYFRESYGFTKQKFYLCTLLPPFILSTAANIVMMILAATVGSENGGWGGLAMLVLIMANCGATFVLMFAIVVWTSGELAKSDRAKKVWAIILLGVCGTIICARLRGLLSFPFSGLVVIAYSDRQDYRVTYILGILRAAAILSIPLGFGVAKLMKIYKEKYSLKPPLFILLAFLPSLLISGGLFAGYFELPEQYYRFFKFTDHIQTVIFTAALSLVSAIIYAVAAFIRSKMHSY